jgi:ABC-type bacteriocin/lantibiotic exporter with double-glycine peptidase domain
LWRDARAGRGALSLADLMALARAHGVRLQPVSQASNGDRRGLACPWIAHLAWQHYVLVEADDGAGVTVADPRAGRYTYSARAFAAAWSGHGLVREGR